MTKRDSVESAKYEINKFFYFYLQFWDVFFSWIRIWIFPDPDFRPTRIRIRTQEKKFDPDPEKNPDPKHWN